MRNVYGMLSCAVMVAEWYAACRSGIHGWLHSHCGLLDINRYRSASWKASAILKVSVSVLVT